MKKKIIGNIRNGTISTCLFVDLSICQLAFANFLFVTLLCQRVNLSFHQITFSLLCIFINMLFHLLFIQSYCFSVNFLFCRLNLTFVTLLCVNLSFHQLAIANSLFCHLNLSFVTLLCVNLSICHFAFSSTCIFINMLFHLLANI